MIITKKIYADYPLVVKKGLKDYTDRALKKMRDVFDPTGTPVDTVNCMIAELGKSGTLFLILTLLYNREHDGRVKYALKLAEEKQGIHSDGVTKPQADWISSELSNSSCRDFNNICASDLWLHSAHLAQIAEYAIILLM